MRENPLEYSYLVKITESIDQQNDLMFNNQEIRLNYVPSSLINPVQS